MADAIDRLKEVASQIASGGTPDAITVRDFLWWWYAERRSHWTVWRIRRDLALTGLETIPDFQETYLDSYIEFNFVNKDDDDESECPPNSDIDTPLPVEDPTYRISKLAAANQTVVSLSPDSTLEEVITVMMENDFSQIPVMIGERDVKGIITWQSIGTRLALANRDRFARDYMEKAQIVSSSDSIFDVIDQIVKHDHVIVRGSDAKITGIITASDLSLQFRYLSEAFLILSEIENLLRILIERRFSIEDLESCKDPSDGSRNIQSVADLSFGEYVRLLENEDRWNKFGIAVDRRKFCASLDRVRCIRNEVMHFDPDGIPEQDLDRLRDFSKFLRRLRAIIE